MFCGISVGAILDFLEKILPQPILFRFASDLKPSSMFNPDYSELGFAAFLEFFGILDLGFVSTKKFIPTIRENLTLWNFP